MAYVLIVPHFPILEAHGVLLHECNASRVEEIRGDGIPYSCQLALIFSILDIIVRIQEPTFYYSVDSEVIVQNICYSNTINFGLSSIPVQKGAHTAGDFELSRGESIDL